MVGRQEFGALELLLPGHYFDEMQEAQRIILAGVKTDGVNFGRGGIFADLKQKKLGLSPKIDEIDPNRQLIGMALNNVRLKWADEEVDHLIKLGLDKNIFNPDTRSGSCTICNKRIFDDTHMITCDQ